MQTFLEARYVTWQRLEGRGEVLNKSNGAISGLTVLPAEIGGVEQETAGSDDTANSNASRTDRWGHGLPAGHISNSASGDDSTTRLPKPQKIGVSAGRVVLATRAVDGVSGSTTGLGVLEHGFALDTTAEGSTGLPEGSTLFAQRVILGGPDRYHKARHGRSVTGGDGSYTGQRCGNEEMTCGSTTHEEHVLLLSDRVRSTTNILEVSSDGEGAPAVTGTNKGFDGNLYTVHLGRTEPGEFIVQVTEEAVNIVQRAGSGAFKLVASWRPPPLPSPSPSSFKVQHAGTAGTIVAVVCESTMILIEVREVVADQATRGRIECDNTPNSAPSPAVQANEVLRAKLDGGPVSALGMRLLRSNSDARESADATPQAPVLIAVASWDSAWVVVLSFPAPTTGNINDAEPEGTHGANKPPDGSTAVPENIATWLPPWGGSVEAGKTIEAREGGGISNLTRVLAFVRFGAGSEGLSLVAATDDGAVAVAEWQGERGKGEWRTGPKTGDQKSLLRGALVTTASFQVGRGPVRLVVFQSAGLAARLESGGERDGGDEERLFVNGDILDVVVRRCSETGEKTKAPGQHRGTWQCTQVCRTGSQSRRSVVFLPRSNTSGGSSGPTGPQFSWLTTEHSNFAPGGRGGGDGGVIIGTETCNSSRFNSTTSSGLSLSFGSLDDSGSRGRCSHKPLPWTPTHVVYVPTSRSIVVACHADSDTKKQTPHPGETATNTDGATPAPRCGTEQPAKPSTAASPHNNVSSSTLRIFDADTLEERPRASPLRLLPGVRVTGLALLPGLGGPVGTAAPNDPARRPSPRWMPGGAAAAAAVGGDVVAAACCSCTLTTEDEEKLGRSGARPAAGVTTVVAAFEVVACGDGGRAEGGSDTRLAALAASPEMAGAWFGLETLGKRFVAGSTDDRIVVLGWEGCGQQGIRPHKPAPPLKLAVQASCRTTAGGCITSLATWGMFVAAAELLHGVSLYRYNESSRVLSLVATHSRDRLVATALTLYPRPLVASDGGGEQERDNDLAPLVALADRTTRTVAVLALPHRFNPSSSTRHIPVSGSANAGADGRGGDGRGEEGTAGGAVRPLRLVSVCPCPERVTVLVAASGTANLVDSDVDKREDDNRGEYQEHQRRPWHQQPHQQAVNEASRFAGGSGRNRGGMLLVGTASGAVWTAGGETPKSPRTSPGS